MTEIERLHEIHRAAREAVECALRYKHALGPPGPKLVGLRVGALTRETFHVERRTDWVDESEDDLVGYPP